MTKTVVIDCFPESAALYTRAHAIVAIDVIRATTSIVTAAAKGRRCFPVPSIEAAHVAARTLENPLLAGEVAGDMPSDFEMNNSPAELEQRDDISRPLIMLSSSGSRLIHKAEAAEAVYVACFRNARYVGKYLSRRHRRVAVIGAGSRGEFREEDQICCAWVANELMKAGFKPENQRTSEVVRRWAAKPLASIVNGNSATYLRRSGQTQDLEFVISHVDDIDEVFAIRHGEAIRVPPEEHSLSSRKVRSVRRERLIPA